MELHRRRASDALQAVDGVLETYLQNTELGGRRMANLAATIAIENSGAGEGALLLDLGDGMEPVFSVQRDLTPTDSSFEEAAGESLGRVEDTAEIDVDRGSLTAPIVLDGEVKGVLYLRDFRSPPGEFAQDLASSAAAKIATLLKNAELLEALDRSQEDLEVLARLTETFSSGHLTRLQLENTVDRLPRGTASESAVLGLFDPRRHIEEVFIAGNPQEGITSLMQAEGPIHVEEFAASLPRPNLFAELNLEEISGAGVRCAGVLAVCKESDRPYLASEISFFNALSHLLTGALARRDYFEKASRDTLTDTGSRLALQLRLAEAEARSGQTGLPFSVLVVDIDRFKEINDGYGHIVGDGVLKTIAGVLRERLRALDSVARYGGDEFVVVLPDTPIEAAAQLGSELRKIVETLHFDSVTETVSTSIGAATFDPSRPASETLRRADVALYHSKGQGRNRVTKYEPKLEG